MRSSAGPPVSRRRPSASAIFASTWRHGASTGTSEEIELTGREYSILELLVRRRGDVVARTTLSEHLYSDDSELMSNAIDVHVASLRRKLGAAVIQTRRGLGYLIDA